ncbi:Innexin unc-9 [Schistosoma japonicum]|nr:Innexin unc-9 [Schistosoma japonicum]
MDANNALKLGRLFRVPYGGEGVDFVDQLNYQFTSGIIVLFIVMIGFRQYVVLAFNTKLVNRYINTSKQVAVYT